MKKLLVALSLTVALGAFADDVNVPWQFTGATNRVAAAESAVTVVTGFARPLPLWLPIACFDSLMPGEMRIDGCDLDTTASGILLLFR